jgi:hypothetical protein
VAGVAAATAAAEVDRLIRSATNPRIVVLGKELSRTGELSCLCEDALDKSFKLTAGRLSFNNSLGGLRPRVTSTPFDMPEKRPEIRD